MPLKTLIGAFYPEDSASHLLIVRHWLYGSQPSLPTRGTKRQDRERYDNISTNFAHDLDLLFKAISRQAQPAGHLRQVAWSRLSGILGAAAATKILSNGSLLWQPNTSIADYHVDIEHSQVSARIARAFIASSSCRSMVHTSAANSAKIAAS